MSGRPLDFNFELQLRRGARVPRMDDKTLPIARSVSPESSRTNTCAGRDGRSFGYGEGARIANVKAEGSERGSAEEHFDG